MQANAELDEEALRRGLDHLQAAEFIYETGLFPDLEYSFKHALTHEVTYGGMLKERRRALHARIVDAMEKLYGHRLEAEIERLAYHAFRGELWTQAAAYLKQAAQKAMARSAFPDATTWFEQALTAHSHLPETRQTLEQAIDIRFDLRNALIQIGDTERMLEHLLEAEHIARGISDQPRLARVSVYLSYAFLKAGDYQRALESGQLAVNIGETIHNRALTVEMDFRLGQVYAALGEYRRALTLLERRAQLGESEALRDRLSPPFPLSLHAREMDGVLHGKDGRFRCWHHLVGRGHPPGRG